MSTAVVIIFALAVVAVTIDVIRRIPRTRRRDPDSDPFVTTQKIIVDLDRR